MEIRYSVDCDQHGNYTKSLILLSECDAERCQLEKLSEEMQISLKHRVLILRLDNDEVSNG